MNIKRRIIGLGAFLLTMMIIWMVVQSKNQIAKYWDYGTNIPPSYGFLGIDISHYQGDIYWEELDEMSIEGDSVSFIFIKASEGLDLIDDKFVVNSQSANERDIPFGCYHYYYPSKSALEQATFFADQIRDAEFDLKPVVDIELSSELSNTQLADSLIVFMDYLELELGCRPLIYTYQSFYLDYLDNTDVSNELYWIASYNESCPLFERENFVAWQFSDNGTVNGISAKVDLNVAKKDFFEKVLR